MITYDDVLKRLTRESRKIAAKMAKDASKFPIPEGRYEKLLELVLLKKSLILLGPDPTALVTINTYLNEL